LDRDRPPFIVIIVWHRDSYFTAIIAPAGGSAYSPRRFGVGADPGHHEHRGPSTNVPTEASGFRSIAQIDRRLVPAWVEDVQPGCSGDQRGVGPRRSSKAADIDKKRLVMIILV
jgi:hypothetical protein